MLPERFDPELNSALGLKFFIFLAVLSSFVKSFCYAESGKVSFILQCMFLISTGNEHEFSPPFFKKKINCIPFEVNVASGFQANGSEAVIEWLTGLRAIEILLPLLICTQMSLPCCHSPVSSAVSSDTSMSRPYLQSDVLCQIRALQRLCSVGQTTCGLSSC